VEVESPLLEEPRARPLPPPDPASIDPLLFSRAARDPDFQGWVDEWILRWTNEGARWFPVYLQRMGAYEELVDAALQREGLPPSLRFLPVVESGYSPRAVSRASAVGLWQFMRPTARQMGLEVTGLVDERRDPVAATGAAVRYLRALRERFDSWFLALAAYNGGPTRVERLLERHAPGAEPSDELYFRIRPHLPRETREYVAKFFAAVRVAEDPGRFGLEIPRPLPPLAYEEVVLPDATSLDVVAELARVPEERVVELNPHLVRRLTPRGQETPVRLPPGRGAGLREAWEALPVSRRVSIREHRVASGETLWGIARQYGLRVRELRDANPSVSPRRMRPGQTLLIPRGGEGGRSANAGGDAGGSTVHVVRPGDTLWDLARRYGTTVSRLRSWNDLGSGSSLRPGQRLRVGGG
jgi:membrane-bound lytic murein transglycosylase D